ncbi:MAG: pilin [Patescibacteria group bacterium]
MKKISKLLFSLIALSLLILPMAVSATTTIDAGTYGAATTSLNLGSSSVDKVATNLINTVLGFLGLLAVIIFLVGGFKWMTAMGNEENIKKAKELMVAGVVGLAIILSAWGITKFVIAQLVTSGS